MVSIDESLIIQIVNFIFLIWVLNAVLYKPIRNILAKRKDQVEGIEEDVESFAKSVVETENAYAAGVKEARAKGIKAKDLLLEEAANEERQLLESISKKAQANFAEVKKQVEKEASDARGALESEIDKFADIISQKILGRAA